MLTGSDSLPADQVLEAGGGDDLVAARESLRHGSSQEPHQAGSREGG
jgi:hypothetical protein